MNSLKKNKYFQSDVGVVTYHIFVIILLLIIGVPTQVGAQTNGAAIFSQMVPPVGSGSVGSDGYLHVAISGVAMATDTYPTDTIIYAEVFEGSTTFGTAATWPRQMANDGESAVNQPHGFTLSATLWPGVHHLAVRTYTDSGRIGTSATYTVNVAGPTPQNGATYVSQYIPPQIVVGANYIVSMEVKNSGSTLWTAGTYWLGSVGDQVWGTTKVDPDTLAPDQSRIFNFPIKAPASPGNYNFRWQMFQNGVAFGDASPSTIIKVIPIPSPTVSLTSTGDGRHYPGAPVIVAFNGTAVAGTGTTLKLLELVEQTSDGLLNTIKTAASPSNFNETLTLSAAIGTHYYKLRSVDMLDHVTLSNAITIYVDRVAPLTSLLSPENGSTLTMAAGMNSVSTLVKGTGSAAQGYTLTNLELLVDGVLVQTPLTGSINKSVTLTGAGSHTITIRATDTSGSPPVTATSTVSVVEAGSPVSFAGLSLINNTGAVLAGQKFNTGINGFVQASAAIGDMVQRVELREGDTILNYMDFPFQMSNDGENPVNVQRNFYNMLGGLSNGTHDIYVRAYTLRNYANTWGDTQKFRVNVALKTGIPVVSFTAPNSIYQATSSGTAGIPVIGSATEIGGVVMRIDVLERSVDGNGNTSDSVVGGVDASSINIVIPLGQGSHKLFLRATDGDHAHGDSDVFNVTVVKPASNNISPKATMKGPAQTTYAVANIDSKVPFTFVGSGTDADGTVIRLELLDKGEVVSGLVVQPNADTTVLLNVGTHTLQVRATDNNFDVGDSSPVLTVVVIAQSTTPEVPGADKPVVSFSSVQNGSTYYTLDGGASLPLVASAIGSAAIQKIEVFDGTGSVAMENGASLNSRYTFLLGPHNLEFRATDARGITGSAYVSFTVVHQIVPPTAILLTPADGATLPVLKGQTLKVLATGTSSVVQRPVVKMEVLDFGAVVRTTAGASLYTTIELAEGDHELQVRATDSQDIMGTSVVNKVKVKSVEPTATLRLPDGLISTLAYNKSSVLVPIIGQGSEAGGNIVRLELHEGETVLASVNTDSINTTVGLGFGVHALQLWAFDAQGVVGKSNPVSVRVSAYGGASFDNVSVSPIAPVETANGTSVVAVSYGVASWGDDSAVGYVDLMEGDDVLGRVKYTLRMNSDGTYGNPHREGTVSASLPAGPHQLYLWAHPTNSAGAQYDLPLTVPHAHNTPPTASIASPAADAIFIAPVGGVANVELVGSGSDVEAPVTMLELLDEAASLGSFYSPSLHWKFPLSIGVHKLKLRAQDNDGASGYSAVSNVTVTAQQQGDAAIFISQSVPMNMKSGQRYTAQVKLFNSGTTTWTAGGKYSLAAPNQEDGRIWTVTGRAYLTAPVLPGETGTVTIQLTAPQVAGSYNFQWQMRYDDSVWFGGQSQSIGIQVTAGAGAGAVTTLNALSNNVRVVGNQSANITLVGRGRETDGVVTRLELLEATSASNFDVLTSAGVMEGGLTNELNFNTTLVRLAGSYFYKLRATDSAGITTESSPVMVNVTNSALLGEVTAVRTNLNGQPELVGWACKVGATQGLQFQMLLDAPTMAAGATQLASGIADVATERNSTAVESQCATPGAGHHFVISLSDFSSLYPGRSLYVRVSDGVASTTLPCLDNNCTVPGTLRIGLTTPLNNDKILTNSVFIRAQVNGNTDAPIDDVSFAVDGQWMSGLIDSAYGTYYVIGTGLVTRAAPYEIRARVRQGNITVYSSSSLILVDAPSSVGITLSAPSIVANGGQVTLSATTTGTSATVANVKFYANGQPITNGVLNGGVWTGLWNSAQANSYIVIAIAYDVNGIQLAQSAPATVMVSASGNGSDVNLLPVVIRPPQLDYDNAGTLPGELSVASSGAAEYGIGLVVPPGTAGMAPELSLNYSGDGVNGLYGLGWSLGGLSSIHRCGKTIAQDGVNGRINSDKGDRLCLDGMRLVLTGNAATSDDAYWADDAVYRTEIDGFTRIKAQGGGSARTFKAERKDGKVMTFGDAGDTVNARVLGYVTLIDGVRPAEINARADAQSWAVDKIVDRSGNFITFHYVQTKATGEHVIDAIRYGGNGLTPHALVKFSYEDRADSWTRYIDGTRHDMRRRVAHIKTYVGQDMSGESAASALVRDYALSYETSPTSGRSLLKQVAVSAINPDSGATETLPATTFDWGKPDVGKTAGFVSKGTWTGAPVLTTHARTGYKSVNHPDYFAFQDFENHGLTDVLERRVASAKDIQNNESLATAANPLALGTMQAQYRYFHNNGNGFDQYQYRLDTKENFVVLDLGDFDGDGAPDLLVETASAGAKICLSPLRAGTGGGIDVPIVFTCASSADRPAMGANYVDSGEYIVDVVGDGRSAIYSDISALTHTASLYIQKEKLVDTEPPYSVLPYNEEDRRNHVSDTIQSFVSYEQMVDFVGIGKHADVRWTLPYVRPQGMADNGEPIGQTTWVNLAPGVEITDFRKPGTPRLGAIRSYALHDEYTPPTCVMESFPDHTSRFGCDPAPYRFDLPLPSGGAVADFSGSGYSNLMFGFVEIDSFNSATRAEATLCLSTGRELDCGKLPQHSGDDYHVAQALGNFVGDGAPSVLIRETARGTSTTGVKLVPVAVGPLQMCRLTGMGDTPAEARTSCATWTGLLLPSASLEASDQVYFMDLLGTGRTQAVYYHAGKFVGNVWQEDGRWELFEPVDVAVGGQALDRIHQVTNGLGAVSNVEYGDGLTNGLVSRAGTTDLASSYPVRVTLVAGKVVSRLKQANGVAGQHSTRYRYFDPATDVAGRGALGYGAMEVTDEQSGIVTTTSYSHVWPKKGLVRAVTVTAADGTILSKTTNTPAYKQYDHASGEHTYLPYISDSVVERHDLDNSYLGTVTTTNTYGDNYGNLTGQRASSTGGSKTFVAEVESTFENGADAWLIGLPSTVITKRTDPVSGTLTRKTTYSYDLSTGLLKQQTVEPGVKDYEVITDYTRPVKKFGLVEEAKQTWRDPVTLTDRSRSVKTTYDDKGRYPVTVTNAAGHAENYQYVAGTGARSQLTDANNLLTSWSTDGFGRLRKETRSDGNETRAYLKICTAQTCPEVPVAATLQITEQFHGTQRMTVPTLVFSDSVGHPIRSQSYAFNGEATYSDRSYDNRGRLKSVSQPAYYTNTSPTLASSQEYDDLNRVTEVTVLDEAGTRRTTKTTYQGLTTIVINPKNQVRTDVRNVIGQVVTVTDAMSGVTEFGYEPFGNLSKTIDPRKNVITVEYDTWGRKKALVDPDLGRIEYTSDSLGRVRKQSTKMQRDGGQSTEMDYDVLDRMTSRKESDLMAAWKYDTAANGKGQLAETYTYTGTEASKDYTRVHTYDSYGRPISTAQTLTDGIYTSEAAYDGWGRVIAQQYRRGTDAAKRFDLRYNDKGYLNRIERNGLTLWSVAKQDPANRPTEIALGNGLTQVQAYNAYSTRLTGDQVKTPAGALRLDQGYSYDNLGNVSQRTQYWDLSGFIEDFTYDNLNRISTSMVGQAKQSFAYYADGSLRSKTGVGTGDYVYPAQGAGAQTPHAVSSIPGFASFSYDGNGNLLAAGGETITWTSFDMPKLISKNGFSSGFVYGSEHQRLRQDRGDGTTIIYAGAQEVENKAGALTIRTYWPMGIGVEIDSPGQPVQLNWIHKDRLGSPVALTGQDGTIVERLAYDAWGKRRSTDGNSTADDIDGKTDHRGYTGHEMLDQLDLVHMNGRVYDPFTAKFLSGDPLIQDPMNGQNYNRYSYVLNNPTNLTDPTGFCNVATAIATRICPKETTEISDKDGNTKIVETKVLNIALKGTTIKLGANGVLTDAKSPGGSSDTNNKSANNGVTGKVWDVVKGAVIGTLERLAEDAHDSPVGGHPEWGSALPTPRELCGGCDYVPGTILPKPSNNEQELGRDLSPAFAILLSLRNPGSEAKAALGAARESKEFSGALSKAVEWLETRGFKAEEQTVGKFGSNAGKSIGMQTADGKVGFRVEYDARSGAHINVWSGKEKGPHFTFDGTQKMVDKIVKMFQ